MRGLQFNLLSGRNSRKLYTVFWDAKEMMNIVTSSIFCLANPSYTHDRFFFTYGTSSIHHYFGCFFHFYLSVMPFSHFDPKMLSKILKLFLQYSIAMSDHFVPHCSYRLDQIFLPTSLIHYCFRCCSICTVSSCSSFNY